MSKAFTRESDEPNADETPASRPPLPPGSSNYITREGAERLRVRLKNLLETKQRLAAKSDDPTTAQTEQRKLESAIRNLQRLLDSVVVAEVPVDREKIVFGATVAIRHRNGEEATYHIVGVDEADPESGSISWISPLARALHSRRAGDKVHFKSPAGEDELWILSVRYPGPAV